MSDANRPSLLFFIETGGPGGAERVVLHLAKAFQERQHAVTVATLREGWLTENLTAEQIDHVCIRSERRFDVALPVRLARVAAGRSARVIHSHLLDSNVYGALAAKLGGLPHVATEHGDVHHIARKRFAREKIRLLALLGTRFTAVSRFTADRLAELGIDAGRIDAVPNPIEPPAEIDGETRRASRGLLGVHDEWNRHWIWLHVANIRPVKDQETLIRGFAAAKRLSSRDQTLCIVGDGEGRAALERLAARLVPDGSIRFLGFRDDVPAWLGAADGIVLSSRSEAMPMSLLEGIAARLFPVSTDVGGVGEMIREREGSLVPPGDPESLGRALAAAADDPAVSRKRAGTAAMRVRRDCSTGAVCESYLRIYRELCDGRASHS